MVSNSIEEILHYMDKLKPAGGRDIRSSAYCGVVRRASSCLGIHSGVRDLSLGIWSRKYGGWVHIVCAACGVHDFQWYRMPTR